MRLIYSYDLETWDMSYFEGEGHEIPFVLIDYNN